MFVPTISKRVETTCLKQMRFVCDHDVEAISGAVAFTVILRKYAAGPDIRQNRSSRNFDCLYKSGARLWQQWLIGLSIRQRPQTSNRFSIYKCCGRPQLNLAVVAFYLPRHPRTSSVW